MCYNFKYCKGVQISGNEIIDDRIGIKYCIDSSDKNSLYNIALENDIIKKRGIIWNKSRLKMILIILSIFITQTLIIFTFFSYTLDIFEYYKEIVNAAVLFNICIFSHEISHILIYWAFEKKYNGYFKIDVLHYSFNYVHKSSKVIALISIAGPIGGMISICLVSSILRTNPIVINFLLIYNLSMLLPFFDDGRYFLNFIKEFCTKNKKRF